MLTPQTLVVGDELWCIWKDEQITMEFSHWRDNSEGCAADVKIVQQSTGATYWGRVSLSSPQSRNNLVRAAAAELGPGVPWGPLVTAACTMAMAHQRAGSPAERLAPAPPAPDQWLLERWIPRGETTVLFGDGGAGKSLLALATAAGALSGQRIGPWAVGRSTAVLYLDWESTKAEIEARLWGMGELMDHLPEPVPVHYRRMARPLTDEIAAVRREAAQHQVDLVICDSLGPACGAEPESADAAVRAMNALRSLSGTTRLVIAHMSKQAADQERGTARPFGSVYVQNLARSVIECRGQQESDTLHVSCYHRKVNAGPLASPAGFRFAFDSEGHILVRSNEADLTRASLPAQIRAILKGGPETVSSLAEQLGADGTAVRTALNRMENRITVRLTDTSGGRKKETLWGLKLKTDSSA